MKKVLDFLKEHLAKFLSLFATFAYAIYAYLGHVHDYEGFAKLLGIGLSAVLAIQVTLSFDIPRRFSQSKKNLKRTLSETLDNLDRYNTHLIPFKDKDAFQELFGGLSGELRSYNPHPFGEQLGAIEEEVGVHLIRDRLTDPRFVKAVYLICTGDAYGEEQLAKQVRRLFHVYNHGQHKKLRAVVESKVEIRIVTDKHFLSEPSFHLQHKGNADRAVFELMSDTRHPWCYVVSNMESFREFLRTNFDSKLKLAQQISLENTFSEIEARNIERETEVAVVKRLLHDGKLF